SSDPSSRSPRSENRIARSSSSLNAAHGGAGAAGACSVTSAPSIAFMLSRSVREFTTDRLGLCYMRFLVVEDARRMAALLNRGRPEEGPQVFVAYDAVEGF